MIRELIAIGKQVGTDLRAFVQKCQGMLYLLDLYPEQRLARLYLRAD